MNRQRRRASQANGNRDPLCPRCNSIKVVAHLFEHSDDSEPFCYVTDDSDELLMHTVIDFGVLILHQVATRPDREAPVEACAHRFWVETFGQVVYDTDDGGPIRQTGQWQRTLATIALQLDDKYGAIHPPEHSVH